MLWSVEANVGGGIGGLSGGWRWIPVGGIAGEDSGHPLPSPPMPPNRWGPQPQMRVRPEALCGKDWNAKRSISGAATAQHEGAWWAEVQADPNKFHAVLKAYHKKQGNDSSDTHQRAKANKFVITQYKEEVRTQQAILFDGKHRMLNKVAFQHWVGKPKMEGLIGMPLVLNGKTNAKRLALSLMRRAPQKS